MFPRVLLAALGALALAGLLAATAPSAPKSDSFSQSAKLRKAVTVDGVIKHLEKLQAIADQNDGHRSAGSPGYDASADYIARRMKKAGYNVKRQVFDAHVFHEDTEATFAQTAPNATEYVYGTDFVTSDFSGEGDITAELVAIDLMIPPGAEPSSSTSGCEADDFPAEVAGKIALIQRGTCDFSVKADNAEAAGAIGVVLFNEGQEGRTDLLGATLAPPLRTIPVVGATFELGEELANGETDGPTGVTVSLFTDTSSEVLPTENVIATSKKGDPDNIVMAGAHLDSVDEGPGINDNGTGSAGILEVAEQMAKLKIKPEHRVRFAWWGAEEAGLLGSEHYIAELTEEEGAKIALYLNFDMIGSPNFGRFIYDGNGSAFGLEGPDGSDTIERVFERYFDRKNLASGQTAFDGRSDYFDFIAVGIPAGGLFTGAEGVKTEHEQAVYGGTAGEAYDPCYHADCDDIENISRRGLDQMVDAVAHSVHKFAHDLKFVREQDQARARAAGKTGTVRERKGDALIR